MNIASAYPELFWSRYTSLGSQIQSPKCSKVLISGVSFCQRSLSQSQESNVLNYSECKIDKNFQGFAPGPYWGGLPVPPQTPHLHNGFSHSYTRWKTSTPQKIAGYSIGGAWGLSITGLSITSIRELLLHIPNLIAAAPLWLKIKRFVKVT